MASVPNSIKQRDGKQCPTEFTVLVSQHVRKPPQAEPGHDSFALKEPDDGHISLKVEIQGNRFHDFRNALPDGC
jgi:hypothetical protein